mgnify:CR=1 FL=1
MLVKYSHLEILEPLICGIIAWLWMTGREEAYYLEEPVKTITNVMEMFVFKVDALVYRWARFAEMLEIAI